MNEQTNFSAMDWLRKEHITPLELELLKGEDSNKAIILGELREIKHEKYTERLISVQLVNNKKVRWLKLRNKVIGELIRAFGEYPENWRGKTITLIIGEERGFDVIDVFAGVQ